MKITHILLAVSVLLASCHQYEKTKSGLAYKLISGGSKEKIKQGQFVKLNLEYKVKLASGKDSVLPNATFGHVPAYAPVDSNRLSKHNFTEILMQCAPGDKVEFVLSVDTLKKMGMIPEYTKAFPRGGSIYGRVEILKTFTNEKEVNEDYMKEIDAEKQREVADIEKYLQKKNIKATKTANGVFVELENAGTGAKVDSGKAVSVDYKGMLLSTGTVFDSNGMSNNNLPFTFVVNQSPIISGWNEGIKLFSEGAKGKIYIPAMLGYGPQGNPPAIPGYSNLIFEITIKNVKDTVIAPAAPNANPHIPH